MCRSNCILLSVCVLSLMCTSLKADSNSLEFCVYQNSWFDSLNVRFIGNWPFGGLSDGVASDSARNLMFLGSGGGVYILDVSAPRNPTKLSESIHTRSHVEDLFYAENAQRLYIADDDAGLDIWDISDPISPQKLGFCDTPGWAMGVWVSGIYAYVADWFSLRIIDISTPSNPQEVGYCDIVGAENVHVVGSYAYVASASVGLTIVDISTPSNPQVVGSCNAPVRAYDVHVSGFYAYVTDYGGPDSASFWVINVFDPGNPYEVSRLVLSEHNPISKWEMFVRDTFAYVASDTFRIINISDSLNPHVVGRCDEYCFSISVAGDYAYCASFPYGQVIHVATPSNPQLVGQFNIPDCAYDLFISDPYAYLADGDASLRILDISSPPDPYEIGSYLIDGNVRAVDVVGNYAYLPHHGGGWPDTMHLSVIEVSDPSNPQQIGECMSDYSNHGGSWDIQVLDSYAYITVNNNMVSGQGGLWIVDVSDPSNPQSVGYYVPPTESYIHDVFVVDTLAFLTSADLCIVDVSDPSNPQQIGYFPTPAWAGAVQVSGIYAYLIDDGVGENVGLRVLDISDPTDPQEVGFCYTNDGARAICISGRLAYIANGSSGLTIIDISVPANPQIVGYYDSPGVAYGIRTLSSYAYLADGCFGLQIYENLLTNIEEQRSTPFKNDNLGATIFSGPLLLPESMNYRIFDITGRVVTPDKIKPGIYFIEVDGQIIQKVVKIK